MIEITYFVHGTTTDNQAKKATGWLPGELSEKGVQLATRLEVYYKIALFNTSA